MANDGTGVGSLLNAGGVGLRRRKMSRRAEDEICRALPCALLDRRCPTKITKVGALCVRFGLSHASGLVRNELFYHYWRRDHRMAFIYRLDSHQAL